MEQAIKLGGEKMKNRLLLSLLCLAALLYIAVPRIPMGAEGLPGMFALAWLLFALIAIGGNISALMFQPKRKRIVTKLKLEEEKRRRLRQYS